MFQYHKFDISKVVFYVISDDVNANPFELLEQESAIHQCQVRTCMTDETIIPIDDTTQLIELGRGAVATASLTYVKRTRDWGDSIREYFVVRKFQNEYDANDDLKNERLAYHALKPTWGLKFTPLFRDNYYHVNNTQQHKYGLYAAFSGVNTDLEEMLKSDSPPL